MATGTGAPLQPAALQPGHPVPCAHGLHPAPMATTTRAPGTNGHLAPMATGTRAPLQPGHRGHRMPCTHWASITGHCGRV